MTTKWNSKILEKINEPSTQMSKESFEMFNPTDRGSYSDGTIRSNFNNKTIITLSSFKN